MNTSFQVARSSINSIITHAALASSILDVVESYLKNKSDKDDYVVSLIEDVKIMTILITRKTVAKSIFLETYSNNEIKFHSISAKTNGFCKLDDLNPLIEEIIG